MATMEDVLYEAHPAMFRNRPITFVICIALIAAFGLGAVILLVWWIRCLGTTLTVTTKRTELRTGLLSKATNEVFHDDVRNVRTRQTFLQRLFNVGYIGISSAGQSGLEIEAYGIARPDYVKELIDQNRET